MVNKFENCLAALLLSICCCSSVVFALPFNDDMVDVQIRPGSSVRAKAAGSVPLGTTEHRLEKKEDAFALVNPLKGNKNSAANGERLFGVHCSSCHGDISKSPYQPGPVAAKFMAPPDITLPFYKEKPDGYIYGTIHFGGLAMMPAVGFKLSPTETWDIINYIRGIQDSK